MEANFQAQQAGADPQRQAVSFPSLQDLGEAPALSNIAVRSSSLGLGRPPASHIFGERSSASSPASSLEEHMGSKHKLLAVTTQLRVAVVCLQECINTLAELHDSFDQNDASLVLRESSFSSLTSYRDRNNKTKQKKKRSSLGELTPRTCNSKSEDELEQNQLEQEEAEQQEEEEEEE